jgi:hypothetical protein
MTLGWSLREQQRWFAVASTHPAGAVSGAEQASAAIARKSRVDQCLTDGPYLSAVERLRIYNDAYFARLEECLLDDYPALAQFLGDAEFSSLVRAYIEMHPSRSPSLNAYGRRMAAFCRSRPEVFAPFAADLARLEWALVEVVHAPLTPGLAQGAFSAIPADRWQSASFTPSPTLRLLCFDYPVNEYYQAFRDGRVPERPERRASATAVYRRELTLWRMDLEPTAAGLLGDLISGLPLGSAIAALAGSVEHDPRFAERLRGDLGAWLGAWVANGFFSDVAA